MTSAACGLRPSFIWAAARQVRSIRINVAQGAWRTTGSEPWGSLGTLAHNDLSAAHLPHEGWQAKGNPFCKERQKPAGFHGHVSKSQSRGGPPKESRNQANKARHQNARTRPYMYASGGTETWSFGSATRQLARGRAESSRHVGVCPCELETHASGKREPGQGILQPHLRLRKGSLAKPNQKKNRKTKKKNIKNRVLQKKGSYLQHLSRRSWFLGFLVGLLHEPFSWGLFFLLFHFVFCFFLLRALLLRPP